MSSQLAEPEADLLVEERYAATLVGLSVHELRQLARLNQLGRFGAASGESHQDKGPLQLTYPEIARLGFLAAHSSA